VRGVGGDRGVEAWMPAPIGDADEGMVVVCGLPLGAPEYVKRWAGKLADRVAAEQRAIIAVLDVPGLRAPRAAR
jgi:hypothetical protein